MDLRPLGHIALDRKAASWMAGYAAYPTPILQKSGVIRIFFVARTAENKGLGTWCDVRSNDPTKIISVARHPLFHLGPPGAFDDNGIGLGNVVKVRGRYWLYYLGWNLGRTVPSRNSIGMAIAINGDGSRFRRPFMGPLIDRNRFDPFTFSYPFVMREGGQWVMYYGTNRGSSKSERTMLHVLTKAYSSDGIEWTRRGDDVISLKRGEYALARPWIIPLVRPVMMFTIYGVRRKIGIARQTKSGVWHRVNDDFIPRSRESWANRDVCYASHIRSAGRDYVFYCGNDYGRTGFGVAELRV